MDDLKRQEMVAQLLEAKNQEAQARERLRAFGATIEHVRAELGNPYFYAGRPSDDPESEAHYTGYKSHEPGLALLQEWRENVRRVVMVRRQLEAAGIESA
jgi:quinol monooxygenase YgiN